MPVNGFSDVIKAVGHEPLGFYSLVFLILGSISYLLIKRMQKPTPAQAGILLAMTLLGFSGVAIAVIRADNKITAQTEQQKKSPSNTAVIKFTGERSSLKPTQGSFSNTSGQVNFGCGKTKPVSVGWNVPAGAEQINASVAWANTDNVNPRTSTLPSSEIPSRLLESFLAEAGDWLGNCPGGGHGELVVRGTYQIMPSTAAAPFESVQSGSESADKALTIPIPTENGLQIQACEATVISDGVPPIVLRVNPIPSSETITWSIRAKRDDGSSRKRSGYRRRLLNHFNSGQ